MRARVPGQPQPFSIFNDVLHQPYPGKGGAGGARAPSDFGRSAPAHFMHIFRLRHMPDIILVLGKIV